MKVVVLVLFMCFLLAFCVYSVLFYSLFYVYVIVSFMSFMWSTFAMCYV